MRNSYFMIFSEQLDYPIYLSFNGYMSIPALYEHETICTVVRHLTTLNLSEFSAIKCSCSDFRNALIKIDFTYKKS